MREVLASPSMAALLDPIASSATMQQQVIDRLREAIAFGQLPPGQRLVQGDLAQALGVSREPVRQALRVLEHEGLIVTVPRQGMAVRAFAAADVEHLAEVRAALERIAAYRAASRLREEDLGRLRSLVGEAATTDPAAVTKLISLDRAFHHQIHLASGNQHLVNVLQTQWMHISRVMYLYLSVAGNSTRVWREHDGLLEALKERDADRAALLAEVHVVRSSQEIVATVGDQLSPAPDTKSS